MNRLRALFTLLVFGTWPATAPAADPGNIQDLERVRAAARDFLVARHASDSTGVRIDVAAPDPRLRLASCANPLRASLAPGARESGNVLVKVHCTGESPWRLYVQARVQRLKTVLVTARPLARGEQITRDDVVAETRDLARLTNAHFPSFDAVAGKRVRRAVGAGVVLSPTMVEAIPVIRRGDIVTIVARGREIEIRVAGEALADAAPGERLRVRNLTTRRIVETTVESAGTVNVLM